MGEAKLNLSSGKDIKSDIIGEINSEGVVDRKGMILNLEKK